MSLDYLFQCLELSEFIEDPSLLPRTYSNISSNYMSLGEYSKALDYLKKSMKMGAQDGDFELKISNANKLGDLYLKLGELGKAQRTFISTINLYEDEGDCALLESHLGLSDVYFTLGALDSALFHAKIAHQTGQQCSFYHFTYQTQSQLATIYLELGEFSLAENYLKSLLKSFSSMEMEGYHELYLNLSILYEKKGEYKEALKFYKEFKTLQDSIFNKKNLRALSRLELTKEFTAEKKILLAQQEAQEKILEEQVAHETQTRNFVLIGLLLLLVALGIGARSYVQIRKANASLEKNNNIIKNQSQELGYKAELLKRSNQEIVKLSNYREGLAHMAVHDMKNPLNTIMGLSEDGEVTKEQLRKINKASRHIFTFLTNVLDIYKFEETKITIDVKPHRVMDQINEAVHDVEIILQEKGITVLTELSQDLVGTYDSELVRRILVNLMANSVKYSKYGQDLLLKGRLVDSELILSVVDFGQGIDPDHLPFLFEKFTSSKPQRISGSASTGIGLNFCQLAVEAHGGRIWAESEVNKGTKISFSFPLLEIPDFYWDENGIEAIVEEPNQPLVIPIEEEIILRSTEALQGLQVYQIGKINKVIADLEKADVTSPWKNKLKAIAYRGDQKDYSDFLTETIQQYGK